MMKIKLVLLLVAPQLLHGMENKQNDHAITRSSISALARNIGSYGKGLTYALLPLAVGCTSMQNDSPVNTPSPQSHDGGVYGPGLGIAVGGFFGMTCCYALFACCYDSFCQKKHTDQTISPPAVSSYDTQVSAPSFSSSFVDIRSLPYIPPMIDIKKIMQSISGITDTEDLLAFGTRYGFGDPHKFFGFYGYQRKTAKAIPIYLHQRCAADMPQMPNELVRVVGEYVQWIDQAVLAKLIAEGYYIGYHNPFTGQAANMAPTLFPWNKDFVKKEQFFSSLTSRMYISHNIKAGNNASSTELSDTGKSSGSYDAESSSTEDSDEILDIEGSSQWQW